MKILIIFLFVSLNLSFAAIEKFDDQKLEKLLEHDTSGLIYIWSSHMPLSILGLEEAQDLASEFNLTFTSLIDPLSEGSLKSFYPVLTSERLLKMGVFNHFPAILIFYKGKLKQKVLHGYEDAQGLKIYIKEILKDEL